MKSQPEREMRMSQGTVTIPNFASYLLCGAHLSEAHRENWPLSCTYLSVDLPEQVESVMELSWAFKHEQDVDSLLTPQKTDLQAVDLMLNEQ